MSAAAAQGTGHLFQTDGVNLLRLRRRLRPRQAAKQPPERAKITEGRHLVRTERVVHAVQMSMSAPQLMERDIELQVMLEMVRIAVGSHEKVFRPVRNGAAIGFDPRP